MRIVLAASTAVTVGLIAFGALGVAGAETTSAPATTTTVTNTVTPTAPPPRTVAVEGVATEPIDPNASAVTATAVYRQGMADAITDGQAKAQFLAGKGGATLGPVQSIAEGGGYIGCGGDVEYQGEQPDFGSVGFSGGNVVAGASVPAVRRPASPAKPAKRPKARKHGSAKKAAAAACTLSTQVSLVYALS
jgi:hypothetical protein